MLAVKKKTCVDKDCNLIAVWTEDDEQQNSEDVIAIDTNASGAASAAKPNPTKIKTEVDEFVDVTGSPASVNGGNFINTIDLTLETPEHAAPPAPTVEAPSLWHEHLAAAAKQFQDAGLNDADHDFDPATRKAMALLIGRVGKNLGLLPSCSDADAPTIDTHMQVAETLEESAAQTFPVHGAPPLDAAGPAASEAVGVVEEAGEASSMPLPSAPSAPGIDPSAADGSTTTPTGRPPRKTKRKATSKPAGNDDEPAPKQTRGRSMRGKPAAAAAPDDNTAGNGKQGGRGKRSGKRGKRR